MCAEPSSATTTKCAVRRPLRTGSSFATSTQSKYPSLLLSAGLQQQAPHSRHSGIGGTVGGMLSKHILAGFSFYAAMAVSGQAQAASPPFSGMAGVTYRALDLNEMRGFYGKGAGFREVPASEKGAVRFGVGQDQFVEFLPGGIKGFVVRFQSITLATPSLKALERDLKLRGVVMEKGKGKALSFRDPFGHLIHVVESKPGKQPAKPAPGFAQHLQHVGFVVHHDLEAEAQKYYGETMGFEEVFRMKDKGGRPTLIKYKISPNSTDIIELLFTWGPIFDPWGAGSMFHLNFEVQDIGDAYCKLFKTGLVDEDRHVPKVNAERLWAIDLFDPEHTRMEVQVMKHATEEIGASKSLSCAGQAEEVKLFNGKNLDGWTGEQGFWRVQDGMIVGESKMYMHYNTFLWHDTEITRDFHLSVWIKQTPSRNRNSGVQFRSHHIDGGNHAIGYQADVGSNLWGRLYHEEGRQHLFQTDVGENAVDWEGWNHYEILAVGHRIWTAVNGTISVAVEDPKGELVGKLALQIHFDPQQVTRFKDLKFVRNPPIALAGKTEAELLKMLAPVKEAKGR